MHQESLAKFSWKGCCSLVRTVTESQILKVFMLHSHSGTPPLSVMVKANGQLDRIWNILEVDSLGQWILSWLH